ncbi:MAG TPA: hypothetical protein VMW50_07435 [Dehalococcoidia bacterium]|nr:hypothetical protein [Dehalococcoidia bacterium]HUW45615.1 hypothetical protein [Dehalococcoidia bacterium]
MARTFPTLGLSPCDFYDGVLARPLGYFEAATSTADMKMVHLIFTSSAVTGTARAEYSFLTLSGVSAGGGESIRGRTAVTAAVGGGVHGGHFGLEIGTGGSITGLGVGCRATFMIPNSAMTGGTVCGGMSELFAEGTSSDISGTTAHSIHRFELSGNSTGRATAQNVFEFANLTTGTGATVMLNTAADADASTDGLRVIINGTPYWILLSSVAPS